MSRVLMACIEYVESEAGRKPKAVFASLLKSILKGLGLIKRLEGKEVRRHYDLGNEFYQLWLDKSMTYSCAFFSDKNMSLEEAQSEKRRIIYEKLQLKEGDRLLDIGCGWGSIILETAQLYGVQSTGITLSKNQYEFVKERIKSLGLEGKAEVYLMHYEDLPKIGRKFNKVVSVGMFEHVGKGRHRKFFEVVREIMKDGGLFLLHTIGKIHISGWLPALHRRGDQSFQRVWFQPYRHRQLEASLLSNSEGMEEEVYFYRGSNNLFQFLLSMGVLNSYPVMRRHVCQPLLSS